MGQPALCRVLVARLCSTGPWPEPLRCALKLVSEDYGPSQPVRWWGALAPVLAAVEPELVAFSPSSRRLNTQGTRQPRLGRTEVHWCVACLHNGSGAEPARGKAYFLDFEGALQLVADIKGGPSLWFVHQECSAVPRSRVRGQLSCHNEVWLRGLFSAGKR